MKQEPISCRADNALAARCQSFAARWAFVLKRPIFYLAAYIDNNEHFKKCMLLNIGAAVLKHEHIYTIFSYFSVQVTDIWQSVAVISRLVLPCQLTNKL